MCTHTSDLYLPDTVHAALSRRVCDTADGHSRGWVMGTGKAYQAP